MSPCVSPNVPRVRVFVSIRVYPCVSVCIRYLHGGPLQHWTDPARHVVQRAALLGRRQERQLCCLAVELERRQQLAWPGGGDTATRQISGMRAAQTDII